MTREMKDSGIEWIGKIPENWEVKKLKYCSSFIQAKYDSELGELPYIGLENIVSWNGNYIDTDSVYDRNQSLVFAADDILWGKLRPYLAKVYHAPRNGCCSGEFCVIRVMDHLDKRYFWNLLITSEFVETVNRSTYGTKMPRANADFIKNIKVPIPPVDEQERIACFLDSECSRIDAVIEKTRASIEEYKKLKQSVITEAVTKGIRPNRQMKDSGIEWVGDMPIEWESINPKALFSQRKEKAKAGERQLTASQQYGVIYQDEYMEVTGNKIVTVEKDFDILKHVEAGDFVISMRSFQGGLEYSTNTGSISSAYVMLIPNLEKVYPWYYRWLLKSSVYINALQSTTNMVRDGRAMRYANFIKVRLFSVPLDEQKEIADYLDEKCAEMDTLIARKEQLLFEMENYKKSLIFEYVTGKKEVTSAPTY